MATSTAVKRLTELRHQLESIDGSNWGKIAVWISQAIPIISSDWPTHVDNFRQEAQPPRFGSAPQVAGHRGGQEEILRRHNEEANKRQASSNQALSNQKKQLLLAFLDGLLRVSDDHTRELEFLRTAIKLLLRNIQTIGSTLPFHDIQKQYFELYKSVKHLVNDPRFEVFAPRLASVLHSDPMKRMSSRDTGEYTLSLSQIVNYLDSILPQSTTSTERMHNNMSNNPTEQNLITVLAKISEEEQRSSNIPVPSRLIADQINYDHREVQDYFELLERRGYITLQRTNDILFGSLTSQGRIILRDPNFVVSSNSNNTTINITGSNPGSIFNISSTLHDTIQTINQAASMQSDSREQLSSLIEQLSTELNKVPSVETEAVADAAQSLVEAATKEKPNKKTVTSRTEELKKAAQDIAVVTPIAIPVIDQIVNLIRGLF